MFKEHFAHIMIVCISVTHRMLTLFRKETVFLACLQSERRIQKSSIQIAAKGERALTMANLYQDFRSQTFTLLQQYNPCLI